MTHLRELNNANTAKIMADLLGHSNIFATLSLRRSPIRDSVLISKFCIGEIGHFNKREKEEAFAHDG
jgi:hypothetical protein